MISRTNFRCHLVACVWLCALASADAAEPTSKLQFDSIIKPFLNANCISCHGPDKAKGKLTLHDIGDDPSNDKSIAIWERVLEQLEIGEMPPKDKRQPPAEERNRVVAWIQEHLADAGKGFVVKSKLLLPEFGNRVSHELLFNGSIKEMPASPSRLWRISPSLYAAKGFLGPTGTAGAPITYSTKTDGIRDYSSQEILGESGFLALMMAFDDFISRQMHEAKDARGNAHFKAIAESAGIPSNEAMEHAIREEYLRMMGEAISPGELTRYLKFMTDSIKKAGNESGFKVTLLAIYLSPQGLYRMELGLGQKDQYGRRMLSPRELAYALSYALTDVPPAKNQIIQSALAKNQLSTRADVEKVVRQIIAKGGPTPSPGLPGAFNLIQAKPTPGYANLPRVERFFEEFFEYPKAAGVFKDGKHGMFSPKAIPGVAQGIIATIVNADQHVFEELLTSPKFNLHRDDLLARLKPYEEYIKTLPANKQDEAAQRLKKYREEAAEAPMETRRAGVLTDRAWLIAHSKCTENDPVHRGKWIRERLLAGLVPDLPIGVDAKIPDDHDRTLRDRFKVVEKAECWKCHKQMNPLGMPFESFNDLGMIRTALYLDKKKQEFIEKIDDKRPPKPPQGKEIQVIPVDATGELSGTGDPALDGPVTDAYDLVHRLAKSTRVRQSIIRHAFRYWMGRNETLEDSKTLIAADEAYVKSGGKFSEVIVSLLTSDSFLYRK